jgi:hypothetical protein
MTIISTLGATVSTVACKLLEHWNLVYGILAFSLPKPRKNPDAPLLTHWTPPVFSVGYASGLSC